MTDRRARKALSGVRIPPSALFHIPRVPSRRACRHKTGNAVAQCLRPPSLLAADLFWLLHRSSLLIIRMLTGRSHVSTWSR